MLALLKRLFDLLGAFVAIAIMVWFVKFLFTSKHAWVGWLLIILCIIDNTYCPDTWLGLEEIDMYNSQEASAFERFIGFKF